MKSEVIDKLATLMAASFGLVAALAWNGAVSSLFKGPCGVEGAGSLCKISVAGPWGYAVIITIIAVFVTLWVAKLAEKAK